MKHYRVRCTFVRLLALAIVTASIGFSGVARGAIVIDWPEIVVISDNINPANGIAEIRLTLTGADVGIPITSFNLDFTIAGSGITFSTPQAATTTPLIAAGTFSAFGSYPSTNVKAAHDTDPPGGPVAGFDNAGLVKVPFTVAPGNVGSTFAVTFNSAFTQIANNFTPYGTLSLVGGSISVAIPEPGAWMGFSLVALVCAAAALVNRRRKLTLA
jgi:hypothetical protein